MRLRGSCRRSRALALAVALVGFALPARAAVRVEQDELVFTVRAPGAVDVYLVGDFNRWNPTVERMSAEGDEFTVRLFLVAGEYRYKFVVDGKWMVDPDNPGPSEQGSPLRLIERGGGLILDTELPQAGVKAPSARGWLRYIGAVRVDDGDADAAQRVDAEVKGSYARLKARARVASDDSSWAWSPPAADAYFDRGRVELDFGRIDVRGLENDSSWASTDPMALVGRAGVYDYDAGFRRHGVAATAQATHAALRVLYADATTRAPRPPGGIPASTLDGFVAGTAADTSVYSYVYTFDDADVLALEATASIGDFDLGVTRREDRGLDPGVRATVEREPAGFTVTTQATREDRRVSNAWLRANDVWGARVTGGFGWGDCDAEAFRSESVTGALPAVITPSAFAAPVSVRAPIMETTRGVAEIVAPVAGAQVKLRWDGTRFDFDGIEGRSRADVNRFVAEGALAWAGWTLRADLTYTDASYGDTPDALYVDWPERNLWLSLWDEVDVPSVVGLGLESYDLATLTAEKGSGRTSAGGTVEVQTDGLAGAVKEAGARAWVETVVRENWRARVDARVAWYDRSDTRDDAFYGDGYLEVGYRWKRISLDLGIGFDPVVFDPVVSDYADIGRTEYLRGAIANGVRRSESAALLDRLRSLEESLKKTDTIKLECVIELN